MRTIFLLLAIFSIGGCRRDSTPPVICVDGEPMAPFRPQAIGLPFTSAPMISHVEAVDLDRDDRTDLIICDCTNNAIGWLRQTAPGSFEEITLAADLAAPAHAIAADMDADGDLDVVVALLGKLFPTNDKIGALVLLENNGKMQFTSRVLMSETARVSDVRCGDIDQDGDLDLAVTQFGYNDGQFGWLRNDGQLQFTHTVLQSLAGGIHGILKDMDGDAALDAVLLVSQDYERIYLFKGDGQGQFTESLLYQADSSEFGSSGIWIEDMDADGKQDIVYTNGDAFDYSPPHPWPWHGVQWLKNAGDGKFEYQRITELGGAVCAAPSDFDGDGDIDLFVGSTFNDWANPASQSLIYLENNGDMTFVKRAVANTPTHIQSIQVLDFDGDGRKDLVSGGMHVFEPYDRVQRIQLWNGIAD